MLCCLQSTPPHAVPSRDMLEAVRHRAARASTATCNAIQVDRASKSKSSRRNLFGGEKRAAKPSTQPITPVASPHRSSRSMPPCTTQYMACQTQTLVS